MLKTTKRTSLVAALATASLTGGLALVATGANAAPAPTGIAVTGLSVVKGSTAGGTNLLVNGTGFNKLADAGVKFGTTAATKVIVLSDLQIAVTAPAGTGKVDVKLSDGTTDYDGLTGTTATKDDFTYLAPYNATVAASSLMSAAGGSTLRVTVNETITGTAGTTCAAGAAAYTANKVTAAIGGVPATRVTCVDDNEIDVVVPAGTQSNTAAKVAVFHDGVAGTADTTNAKYAAVVTGLDKVVGPVAGGGTVVVTGKGFTGGGTWRFGTVAATCTAAAAPAVDTKVTCTVPAGTAGAVSVNFVPGGSAPYGTTSKATYTYSDLG